MPSNDATDHCRGCLQGHHTHRVETMIAIQPGCDVELPTSRAPLRLSHVCVRLLGCIPRRIFRYDFHSTSRHRAFDTIQGHPILGHVDRCHRMLFHLRSTLPCTRCLVPRVPIPVSTTSCHANPCCEPNHQAAGMFVADARARGHMATPQDTTVAARPGAPCPYFGWYGFLPQHQHLLLDHVRTGAYREAVLRNGLVDFLDQVVMDCGCGCGALSLYALQAGARKVYAVEASHAAQHAKKLCHKAVEAGRMEVVQVQVEEMQMEGERVDVILCEGMGNLLLHERMMESYLLARDRFLKPGGKMYPARARLHFAPFQEPWLRQEVVEGPAAFWTEADYLGLDLRPLYQTAVQSYLSQPLIGVVEPCTLLGAPSMHEFDLYKVDVEDLQTIHVPVETIALQDGKVDGLAGWFDVAFDGSEWQGWLSTAPGMPTTHWQQVRCLLTAQLPVCRGDKIWGHVDMKANASRSYDVHISLRTEKEERSSCCIHLDNPGYYPFHGTRG